MGTKANPGKYDCYAKAYDNEPIFILRAKDPLAAALVDLWANLQVREYRRENDSDLLTGEQEEKVREARDCAETMRLWRRGYPY